jgi:N-dimethylarginine dimethylaminohydrolase
VTERATDIPPRPAGTAPSTSAAPDGPRFGVRSSTADLRRVLVATPTLAGDFAAAGWRVPDGPELLRQHAAFADLLESLGIDVVRAQAPAGLVDACFTHDSVYVVPSGAVLLRAAKPARAGEAAWLEPVLESAGVPVVGRLEAPATCDGGDMFWLDEATLAVARGYRTNAAAHAQLAELLAADGVRVERFDLPHHLGPAHVLHLMSVCSPVADDLAVVHPPLAPVALLEALADRGTRTLAVPEDELDTQGGNVLAVRPGVVVLAEGNRGIHRALEAAGVEVHTYAASELNKGDGGPTCLTRPLWRGP